VQLPDIRIHNFVDVSNQQFVTVCILHIYSSVDYTDICYICWCQQLIFNETFIYAYDVYIPWKKFLLFTHTYISLEWNSTDTYSLDDTLCMKLLRYKHTSLNFFLKKKLWKDKHTWWMVKWNLILDKHTTWDWNKKISYW
jgi:hypothetical protein